MILKTLNPRQVEWQGTVYCCAMGRSGLTHHKHEGDGATPCGTFRLCHVYYRPDRLEKPQSLLPVTALASDDGWCDDPTDPLYNQLIKLPYPARHEVLWREDFLYDLFITTDHNQNPTLPGAGSAIFIHLARIDDQGRYSPTAGCLALAFKDLSKIIETSPSHAVWIV